MKTKSIIYCFILAVGFLGSQIASAQTATQDLTLTVDGSALLSVTGGTVKMALTGATEAGAPVTATATDTTSRLRISSLSGGGPTGRTITAGATLGLVDSKTSLSVQLLRPTTASLGNFVNYGTEGGALQVMGLVANDVAVTSDVTLVTGIKTCWSGTGDDDGYVIKYLYAPTGGGSPKAASVTVTYTIGNDL